MEEKSLFFSEVVASYLSFCLLISAYFLPFLWDMFGVLIRYACCRESKASSHRKIGIVLYC